MSDGPIIEIIRFRVREGAETALLDGRAAAVAALSRSFGMETSTLCRADEGGIWVDVMRFPSAAAADRALDEEMGIPEFAAWVANVEEVVARERIGVVSA